MKKIVTSLLATIVLMGSSLLMAGEQTFGDEYCTVAKTSNPEWVTPAVVSSDDLIVLNEQEGNNYSPAVAGISNPDLMLLAEHTGDLRGEEILLMAKNRNTTIYVSSIGGFGGTGVSSTETI